MGKKTKIWVIIATALILIGCIIFGSVMTVLKWDFTKLSTVKFETNGYEINENYKNISVITNTAELVFVASNDQKTSVTCFEEKSIKHSVAVKDDTLVIEAVDTRKWYEYIGINFKSPKITVSLPAGEWGTLFAKISTGNVEIPKDFTFENIEVFASTGKVVNYASALKNVKIKTTTGSVCAENFSAGQIDVFVTTGDLTLSHLECAGDVKLKGTTGDAKLLSVQCQNLETDATTGSVLLNKVIAKGNMSIKLNTGNVKLEDSDAAELFIKTTTGKVSGSLLSEKVFIPKTSTGSINLPNTTAGGKCEITTSTGNIDIVLAGK